jgi:predicted small lipoprotein YifL
MVNLYNALFEIQRKRNMWLKTIVGIILAFGLLLQGCGRKGPLTMPTSVVQNAPASSVPAAEKP